MKFNYSSNATYSYCIKCYLFILYQYQFILYENCQTTAQRGKITLIQNPISINYKPLCMLIILLYWKILLGGYFFDNLSQELHLLPQILFENKYFKPCSAQKF